MLALEIYSHSKASEIKAFLENVLVTRNGSLYYKDETGDEIGLPLDSNKKKPLQS